MDGKTIGENLLAFRKSHPKLKLSEVHDLAITGAGIFESDSNRSWRDDRILLQATDTRTGSCITGRFK